MSDMAPWQNKVASCWQKEQKFYSKEKYLERLINWNVLENVWNVLLCFSWSGMYHGTVQ